MSDDVVIITHHNRPLQLNVLLSDLKWAGFTNTVVVDHSSSSKAFVIAEGACRHHKATTLIRTAMPPGKYGYSMACSIGLNHVYAAGRDVRRVGMLQDDCRVSVMAMQAVQLGLAQMTNPAALMPFIDAGRRGTNQWTMVEAEVLGEPSVCVSGWTDGITVLTREALDAMGWRMSGVPRSWTEEDSPRSSGIWALLSWRLHELGFSMGHLMVSPVAHCSRWAETHPYHCKGEWRRPAAEYSDGPEVHRELLETARLLEDTQHARGL